MSPRTRALLLGLLLSACASGPDGATFRGRSVAPDRFGLVVLRTGEDPPALTAEEQSEAFAGHFGFIEASAERGELLVAGPFGQPKDIDDLRGLFLFDASDEAEIAALGAGDPTTRMGVFQQDAMTLDTLDLLRRLPEMLRDREVERADPGSRAGHGELHGAVRGRRPCSALRPRHLLADRVVLLGRLGAPREDAFGILDVVDPEEVRARLAAAGLDVTRIELARWYATPALREFARPDAAVADPSSTPR